MKKILKWIGVIFGIIIVIAIFSPESEKTVKITPVVTEEQTTQESRVAPQEITVSKLLAENDPNVKRLSFTGVDYVGKTFTLYVMAKIDDYYNYGFDDETRYYSLKLWDSSVSSSYEGVYAYIDKKDPIKKAGELVDVLLQDDVLLKAEVSIPSQKYEADSNAFLQIEEWEIVE